MNAPTPPPPSSLAEVVTAFKALAPEEPRGIEKHVQALLYALVLGMLAWVLSSTNDNGKTLVRIETQLEAQKDLNGRFDRRIGKLEDWRHEVEGGGRIGRRQQPDGER